MDSGFCLMGFSKSSSSNVAEKKKKPSCPMGTVPHCKRGSKCYIVAFNLTSCLLEPLNFEYGKVALQVGELIL